jgi:hypothetical protein
MIGKNVKKLFFALSLSLMWIVSNSLVYPTVSSFDSTFFSYGQDVNSTEGNGLFFGINNATGLSLIPLMIKEMQNTNATAIPIKQVVNATPSNATALQSISKNTTNNDNTNASDATNDLNSVNDATNDLLHFDAPSNATALQNMTRGSTNASDATNDLNSVNSTTQELIPLVVNLTENTNATDIAMARTINATPSNATALQNMTGGNTSASDANSDFNSVNDTTKS